MEIRHCRETSEVETICLDDKALDVEIEKTNKRQIRQIKKKSRKKKTERRNMLLLVSFACRKDHSFDYRSIEFMVPVNHPYRDV